MMVELTSRRIDFSIKTIAGTQRRSDTSEVLQLPLQVLKQLVLAACIAFTGPTFAAEPPSERLASWAHPIEAEGVPNLFKVSDSHYRSAQPSAEGMKNLHRLGIKTIVNLRSFHSDRDEIGKLPLAQEHITMKAWHPGRKELVRFLQIVGDPRRTPVLVHCQHGADRTGTVCAVYRIAVDGWAREEAIQEMREGGFGYHEIWKNLPRWIEELDVEGIERDTKRAGGNHSGG